MSKFAEQFDARYGRIGRVGDVTKIIQADHNISKILNKDKEFAKQKKIKEDIQRLLARG